MSFLRSLSRRYFFEQISVSYDSARAFVQAQEDALKLIESMNRGLESESIGNKEEDAKILDILEEEITENRMLGQTFLRNLRKNYPEIYTAVATRQAIRTLLNYEKRTVERMQKNGQLESGEAHSIIEEIEERMKRLMDSPPVINMPETEQQLRESALFKDLDAECLEYIIPKFQTRIYSVGDRFIKESAPSDGLYFIARGNVRITHDNKDLDILGRGDFIGEIASLTGARTADVVAESPVTVFWMSAKDLNKAVEKHASLHDRIWQVGGERITENELRLTPPYDQWKLDQIKSLVKKGRIMPNEEYNPEAAKEKVVILLHGSATAESDNKKISGPVILDAQAYKFDKQSILFVC